MTSHTHQTDTHYLDLAIEAARWIRSNSQETGSGLTWLPDPDQPAKATTLTAPATIYSGSAGIVLFLIELAHATGDDSWLDDAHREAAQLAATWREVLNYPALIPIENANLDFQMGLVGTAFTLAHAFNATKDTALRDAALDITRHIVGLAQPAETGITWTHNTSVKMGDGSIILFLLWAAREFNQPSFREVAARGGDYLLSRSADDPRGGLSWPTPGYALVGLGIPGNAVMPNFELGTAGTAYVMARLHAETGDSRFLTAARGGAEHVQQLATVQDDAALLFYRYPDHLDLYCLGYCHGPVGTSRLFYELHRITGEPGFLEWTERFARGILQSGIGERQTPGLWNVTCQCCGTAGIADYFTSLYLATANAEYLAFAERMAGLTASRTSDTDGNGARWYQAWTRTQPGSVAAETG